MIENSLLMNIFTPYLPGTENPKSELLKPVMFWLHGGGGTATDPTSDGASLTSRSDVILVSINWRGGNFGTLTPTLSLMRSSNLLIHRRYLFQ